MSRRSIIILLLLALLGAWGIWRTLDHGHLAAPTAGANMPDPGFCPRFGANPPQRLPVLHDIVSISFTGSRLTAVDREGNVWTYFRGESRCDDPAPIKVLSANSAKKLYPQAGLPRAVQRDAVLLGNQAIIAQGLEFPDHCGLPNGECIPARTTEFDGVVAIARGDRHLLVARNDGSLWSSGMDDCGQLGRHAETDRLRDLVPVPGMKSIIAVAAGMRSSMALDSSGTVFTWGSLSNPLLSSTESRPAAGAPYCPYKDIEWAGHLLSGARDGHPREVAGLPRIRQIASYYATDLALDTEGRVWGWGFNTCGQLGVSPGEGPGLIEYYIDHPRRIDGLPHIEAIASGKRHSLALDGDGRVWAWGESSDTKLGVRAPSKERSPACDDEGARAGRAGFTSIPQQVPGIGKAVAIAAGFNSSAAIDEHGDVWVWGRH